MPDFASSAKDAKAIVSARLGEVAGALDGFPAALLIDEWLRLVDADPAAARRSQHVILHILAEWAATIQRDLDQFPPASMDALQNIRQRMVESHEALLRLQSMLTRLGERAPRAASNPMNA